MDRVHKRPPSKRIILSLSVKRLRTLASTIMLLRRESDRPLNILVFAIEKPMPVRHGPYGKESLLFVHEEDKPGKWESADTHFVAAVISKKQQSQGSG